ncbi:putative RNA-binding protein [Lachnellula occidentalis]|uniref:Putative RNA-binding protein n=1 Tax=Lachnellula occidentalis TaxID=215460 RepID=A0A8H8SB97_9HELO|nr:putative RNA-binding protein [Lachnellula occidentalis]
MTDEAPEFRTKTLSPFSPLPVHPPEPSNIPVLQNQIDPVFNMTSTHIDNSPPHPLVTAPADSSQPTIPENPDEHSPSADSSFSDAYREQPTDDQGKDANIKGGDQDREITDDYAMTFDSDGEERTSSQDLSQANIEQTAESLPVTVPATNLPPSLVHDFSHVAVPANDHTTHTIPSPSLPVSADATADYFSDGSADVSKPTENITAESTAPKTHTYEGITNGDIDIQQLLDNITANAEKNEPTSTTPAQPSTPNSTLSKGSSTLPSHASLPPRPQVLQNRNYPDDMQKYHAGPPGVPQQANSSRPVGAPPSLVGAGAPGTSTDPRGGLPPPPVASFRPPSSANSTSPSSYTHLNRPPGQSQARPFDVEDEADETDARWGPDVQKIYDEFLVNERMYVTEGIWDRFPKKSRLFIGNLPSEKVTKRDLFHVFHKYGKLAQVSIKQAYGFIQFHEDAACAEALAREQGAEVRGRKMHLEISRPQKNTRNAAHNTQPPRRSRSPEYARGGMSDRGGGQGQGGRMPNIDRYDGRSNNGSIRQDEYGRPLRMRDDYRPVRSPTPPRYRGRDDYASRGRDSYGGRDRRRSRSRSPYGNRDDGRYRERSLSPRARQTNEDLDLQIPRRDQRNVPDVQIILMDQLDRAFVSWVEGEFLSRGIKTEVMFLSARLPLQAVIRRQILEGVYAVLQLDMRSQIESKVPLQVFDRQGGANNVRFDEYQDLEPRIAAELVHRAKQAQPVHQPPPQTQMPQYTQPQFASGQAYQPPIQSPTQYQPSPAPAPAAPNLASLVGQLDNSSLQQLLYSMNTHQPQQQNAPAVASNSAIDLAGLLGGLNPPQQGYQPQPAASPYANLANNPALASILGHVAVPPQAQSQPQPQQSTQQVQNIMAQLARFRG